MTEVHVCVSEVIGFVFGRVRLEKRERETHTHTQTERERERERETDRQTDREREPERERARCGKSRTHVAFNSLPNGKFLDWSKLKAIADDRKFFLE